MGAINLYMKAGLPARAARVALEHSELTGVSDVMERIAAALMKAGLFEKVGKLVLRSCDCVVDSWLTFSEREILHINGLILPMDCRHAVA